AVKVEGGSVSLDSIRPIIDAGVPVMGHLGLTPQSIHKFRTHKVRAREAQEADDNRQDTRRLEEADCIAVDMEIYPSSHTTEVTASVGIPTIGIGAGAGCSGQVLVTHDLLGLTKDFHPRFVRRYAELADGITEAVQRYVEDVRARDFPSPDESY